MKDRILLPEGRCYKANLHCHTTCSDGRLTPEEVKAAYKAQGYSVIAYSDHRNYQWHRELDDENFLALAATEVDLTEDTPEKDWPLRKTFHLNLLDTDPTARVEEKAANPMPGVPYGDLEGLNAYIARMTELGFLVTYNHPSWSLQDYRDYAGLRGLFAMEIYNHGCEHDGLYGFQPQVYDEMLRAGQKLFTVATDDNHDIEPLGMPLNDSFGGSIRIAAKELTYPAVIEALKAGRFYWSMGPEVKSAVIRNGVLAVDTSPVEKIFVMQEGRDCYKRVAPAGKTIDHAEFPLTGKEGWIRVQIRDGSGLYAGTNAYFLNDPEAGQ